LKKILETDNIKTLTILFLVSSKQSVEPDEHVDTVFVSPEVGEELDNNVTSPSVVVSVDVPKTDTKFKDLNSN